MLFEKSIYSMAMGDEMYNTKHSHLKTHFETPGAAQVESLNKLAIGMKRNAAAQLFYQSCGTIYICNFLSSYII